ncbi:YicC/YloC family endoribonuclease [Gilvibacter sp. SZ-19]|uniref:YicC/YloC family endoribonuclease n=1 Tax=unclassified Gilvibacter TaxID=2625242 RepID=UPI000B3C1B3B|nr:YicC/YloC family endoribonuclease [Gilvibacter sp. SZ-19]ARV11991.1 YicC family protein [Gilvibacter sp. SZ-19]
MIHSMTGYGKAIVNLPNKKITIELKSLNSKNLDLNARIPSHYREKELEIRNKVSKALVRGKIDLGLFVELTGEATSTSINGAVVQEYIRQLNTVVPGDAMDHLQMAMRLPDALKTEREDIDPKEYASILEALETALAAIKNYRSSEGADLEKDFKQRVANISEHLEAVKAMDPERMGSVRERLTKAVSDLKEQVDQNRFEQELIYYLEKYDINEEVVRLQSHLDYFIQTMDGKQSNGKKLGFISQEMGREINTIGSKSNYAPMQQIVVRMKDELEKIKEQCLNVL